MLSTFVGLGVSDALAGRPSFLPMNSEQADDHPGVREIEAAPAGGDLVTNLLRPASLGVLGALLATSTAIYTWVGLDSHKPRDCDFTACTTTTGASIHAALYLVVVGGLVGSLWFVIARNRPRLLAASLLVGAAVLGLALGLVAVDSATYVQRSRSLFGLPPETSSEHLGSLYLVWGAPLVLLVFQAGHAWLRSDEGCDQQQPALTDELLKVLAWVVVVVGFALGGALVGGLVGAAIGSASAPACDPDTEMLCGLEGVAGGVLGAGIGLLLGLLTGSLYLWRGARRRRLR